MAASAGLRSRIRCPRPPGTPGRPASTSRPRWLAPKHTLYSKYHLFRPSTKTGGIYLPRRTRFRNHVDGCEIPSHHFETTGKRLFVGSYRGIESFQGFLGGAKRISSIHRITAQYHLTRDPSSLFSNFLRPSTPLQISGGPKRVDGTASHW